MNLRRVRNRPVIAAAALVVFAAAFLLLDAVVMNMQGLSLIYHG